MARNALLCGWLVALLTTLTAAAQPGASLETVGGSSADATPPKRIALPTAASQRPADQSLRVIRAIAQNPKSRTGRPSERR